MTTAKLKQWATERLKELEPRIGEPATAENARVIGAAKAACYSLGMNDFALSLPDDAERKTALTAANQLRRILKQLETPTPPTNGADMSVAQVAALLGVSKETVYRLCREGDLTCNHIGTRITVTGAQLAEYRRRLER